MKTLLSAVAVVALLVSAGAAMAQDDENPPVRHHHARVHHERAAPDTEGAVMRGERTEHGGPPSSPTERAQTEQLNNRQLGGPGQSR